MGIDSIAETVPVRNFINPLFQGERIVQNDFIAFLDQRAAEISTAALHAVRLGSRHHCISIRYPDSLVKLDQT